jgi:cytoskeletal protein RodZ
MMRTDVEHLATGAKSHLNLAGARNERGVTLEEITQSTRIAGHFLEAIETENFGQLPGGVYNTSYIRQYARAIGYDETALLGHYRSQIEPPEMVKAAPSSSFFRIDEVLRNFLQYVTTRRRSQHPA